MSSWAGVARPRAARLEHRPVALPTPNVLLLESATTVNTGSATADERTVTDLQRRVDL
mgnify:CR=1 FL=1